MPELRVHATGTALSPSNLGGEHSYMGRIVLGDAVPASSQAQVLVVSITSPMLRIVGGSRVKFGCGLGR
jgi:hypothetical protein